MSNAATLIVTSANLLTFDDRFPRATAMAITNDRIFAVGSDDEISRLASPTTQRLNLEGKTVTPGFCDCHLHLYMYGAQLLREADLVGSKDIPEILSRLSDLAARTQSPRIAMRGSSENWIVGHGFDQSKIPENRFPFRSELD